VIAIVVVIVIGPVVRLLGIVVVLIILTENLGLISLLLGMRISVSRSVKRVVLVTTTLILTVVIILFLVIIYLFFAPFSLGQNGLEDVPGFHNNLILLLFLKSLIESIFHDLIIVT